MKPLEEMGRFKTVVVDPPWPLKRLGWVKHPANGIRNAEECYRLATLEDIAALPIADVLDKDALLFAWCTNGTQRDAVDCMPGWGVTFKFTMVWVKNGGIQVPQGPAFNAEYIQVGKRGRPQFVDVKAFNAANFWPRTGHSEKPEGFYDLLRRVTPSPRLDIFGRRRIAGFHSWGNEAPEGLPPPDHYQTVLDMEGELCL